VDPGVGSERRPIALAAGDQRFVGPDNGLLWAAASRLAGNDSGGTVASWTVEGGTPTGGSRRPATGPDRALNPVARLLENPAYRLPRVSATFHGRDLFAPAAAHLARGVTWESLGPPVADPVRWEPRVPRRSPRVVTGEILAIDRYGNAVTNLEPADADALHAPWGVEAAGALLLPATHYAAVPPGEPLVVLGSLGTYEVAVNQGSAADRFQLRRGDPVRLVPV
jgi:S-adenosylmethionine hydrolase